MYTVHRLVISMYWISFGYLEYFYGLNNAIYGTWSNNCSVNVIFHITCKKVINIRIYSTRWDMSYMCATWCLKKKWCKNKERLEGLFDMCSYGFVNSLYSPHKPTFWRYRRGRHHFFLQAHIFDNNGSAKHLLNIMNLRLVSIEEVV